MKRFLALAMSLVIGATSVWTTGLETRAAEGGDFDETALIENGEEEDVYDNIFGDDPINKKDYYATFTVETNGEQIVKKYKISGAARVPKDNWVLEPVSSFNADEDYDDYEYDYETGQYIYYKKVNHPQLVSGNQTLAGYAFYSELKKDLDTFLAKDKGAEIVGWTVYTDGHNSPEDDARTTQSKYSDSITYLNSDACTYGNSDGYWDNDLGEWVEKANEFKLDESRDYHFVAQVAKKAAEDIYVSLIPSVNFDGREHIAQGTELKRKDVKNKATDLRVGVFRKTYGGYERLYAGTDYSIEYKNNINASVKLVRDGENAGIFEKAWSDNSSRPTVHVEGINDYKGFSADMYFDILPVTLGASESRYDYVSMEAEDYYYYYRYDDDGRQAYGNNKSDAAGVSGLAYTYTPSTVKKINKITVTKSFSNSGYFYNAKKKTIETYTESYSKTLNADADYKLEVYKWNADTKAWILTGKAPKECTEEGDYLCVVRGIGNYCGAVYGYSRETTSAEDNMFNAGGNGKDPNPFQSNATYMQFKVTKNAAFDLTKAKVKIGAKKKKYVSDDKKYGASDFKITVKAGKKKIKLGEDYTVSFSPAGGSHMKNENGVNYGSTIAAANLYNVYVYGIGNYYGSKYAGTVKITGLTLKANMFTYLKKVGHDQEQKVELSDKGKNKKLTFTDKSSPYYVPDVAANKSPYTVKSGKKGTTYSYYMGDSYHEDSYYDAAGKYVSGSTCRIGNGIYPKTVKLQYLLKYEKISIEQAINEKRLGIKLGEKPAEFNYGGAYPDVTLTTYYDKAREEEFYNEETGMMEKRMVDHDDSQYDGEGEVYKDRTFAVTVKGYHYTGYLTVTGQNNTAVGTGATLTFAGSGILTGTKTENFTVAERNVEYLKDAWYSDLAGCDPSYDASSAGEVSVVIKDRKKGSGEDKFTPADIRLYQTYYEHDTDMDYRVTKSIELPQTLYDVTENEALGSKGIAWRIYAKDGSEPGLNFGRNEWDYETDTSTFKPSSIEAGIFALYDKDVALTDADTVNLYVSKEDGSDEWEGKDFRHNAGLLDYVPKFTGNQIRPDLNSIKTTGTQTLYAGSDIRYSLYYGYNLTAGTEGTMKCRLQYNEGEDTYAYGGDLEFRFNIGENEKVVL